MHPVIVNINKGEMFFFSINYKIELSQCDDK